MIYDASNIKFKLYGEFMKNILFTLGVAALMISSSLAHAKSCDDAVSSLVTQAKEINKATDLKSAEDRLKVATEFAKLSCKLEGISSVSVEEK